jgi:hypothetical protein
MGSAMLLMTDKTWTDLSDAADHVAREGAHKVQGLGDSSEEAPTRAGAQAHQIDRAALKLCIRTDLWP